MMRPNLKSLLIVCFLLIVLLFSFSAFFPSEVMTSKWVMIRAEKKDVIKKIEDLSDWRNWNLLVESANDLTINQKNHSLAIGDGLTWTSSSGKKNKILITQLNADGIGMDIDLSEAHPIRSGFSLAQRNDSVQVVWFIVEKLEWYPWEKIYGMMASELKGPALQYSLDKFKKQF